MAVEQEPEDDLIAALNDVRERREKAKADERAATEELPKLIRTAVDRAIPMTEIAKAAGISRQAAYDFLRK